MSRLSVAVIKKLLSFLGIQKDQNEGLNASNCKLLYTLACVTITDWNFRFGDKESLSKFESMNVLITVGLSFLKFRFTDKEKFKDDVTYDVNKPALLLCCSTEFDNKTCNQNVDVPYVDSKSKDILSTYHPQSERLLILHSFNCGDLTVVQVVIDCRKITASSYMQYETIYPLKINWNRFKSKVDSKFAYNPVWQSSIGVHFLVRNHTEIVTSSHVSCCPVKYSDKKQNPVWKSRNLVSKGSRWVIEWETRNI